MAKDEVVVYTCARCGGDYQTKGSPEPHGVCGRRACVRALWGDDRRQGAARLARVRAETGGDLTDADREMLEWAAKHGVPTGPLPYNG